MFEKNKTIKYVSVKVPLSLAIATKIKLLERNQTITEFIIEKFKELTKEGVV